MHLLLALEYRVRQNPFILHAWFNLHCVCPYGNGAAFGVIRFVCGVMVRWPGVNGKAMAAH